MGRTSAPETIARADDVLDVVLAFIDDVGAGPLDERLPEGLDERAMGHRAASRAYPQ